MRWPAMAAVVLGLLGMSPSRGGEAEDAAASYQQGLGCYRQGDLAGADKAWQAELLLREHLAPGSAAVANSLNNLGAVAQARGDLAAAAQYHERALAIRERLSPDSLDVASSLANLGMVAMDRRDHAAAEGCYRRALAIRERLAPGSLPLANSLLNLADLLHHRGDLPGAETYYRQAVALREQLVPDSLLLADSLDDLACVTQERGDLTAAEACQQRALAIRNRLAPASRAVAASLTGLGNVANARGDAAAAQSYFERALAIHERLAPNSKNVAVCLTNLGNVAWVRGDVQTAEAYYRRAAGLWERLLPDSDQLASSLNGLGNIAWQRGDQATATALYGRALALRERLAPDSLGVANVLGNLGNVAWSRGDLATAESLFGRALAIRERLAPDSLDVALSLHSLGNAAHCRGDLAEAERLNRRALAIRTRLAPDSALVAASLTSLGNLAGDRGDLAAATALRQQALALCERLVPDSLQLASALHNAGNTAADRDGPAAAEAYYRRALAIQERLAPDSLDLAGSLNSLGLVATDRHDTATAEQYYRRSLALRERLAPDSVDVAQSLNNLGNNAKEREDLAAAEVCHQRAAAIYERLAPGSLSLATSLNNLALVQAASGRLSDATIVVDRAMQTEQAQLRRCFPAFTEREKAAFVGTLWRGLSFTLSLALLRPNEPRTVRSAADWALRRKGIVLSALLDDRRSARLLTDPATAEEAKELQTARATLSHLVVAGPGALPVEAHRQKCDALAGQIELLLRSLAAKSAAVRGQQIAAEVDTAQLCRALRPGSVLIEVAAVSPRNFAARSGEPQAGAPRYVAFILRPAEPQPTLVDLGEAQAIDRAVGRARQRLALTRNATVAQPLPAAPAPGGGLYELVWAKLEPHLGGARRIYFSPDGQLNLVAMGAVRDPAGRYLAETYTFSYLASGRDLLRPPTLPRAPQWLVVSNPDFDGDPGGIAGERGTHTAALDRDLLAGTDVQPLPGTKVEGEQVAALAHAAGATVVQLVAGGATEARVKAVTRPTVLHLATHGFFLADADSPLEQRGGSGAAARRGAGGTALQRSGLLLAGAARSLKGAPGDGEDGILTAEEVVGMDLEGTRLVCLSACQTGLGEVQQGEGVMGLRRAFQLAGAESLVMSLWSVPDAETRDLMVRFYQRFAAGEPAPDAMAAAQRAFLAARRALGQSDAPFWWAAFVVGGT